jgi:asparagine synthase (glutamine-hydrolysing)
MCGIAGVISWSEEYRVTRELLSAMSAKIAHRGPDGEGIFLTRENEEISADRPQAGFAFRRLAILDPDPRAMQPFTIGHQTIVFNGEIYNFRELREELNKIRPEYEWRTTGDTEVLLLSYATWGEKCLERLNGMFAFGVWDERKGEVFLARDRMGQKPLYVAWIAEGGRSTEPSWEEMGDEKPFVPVAIIFASELPAVLLPKFASESLDEWALNDYLQFGYIVGAQSIYRGVRKLLAGMAVRANSAECVCTRYWPPVDIGMVRFEDSQAVQKTRELFGRAVRRQLVSDVPLGCLLSGGIDSSCIAAAMAHAADAVQSVHTFSIGFEDFRYNESEYAEAVAKHLGTTHHAFILHPDAAADLPKLAAVFGEPFADSSALPTQYLARETRHHVKVALGGDGGDELFGGYDRYRAMRLSQLLRRATTPLPWVALQGAFARLPGSTHPKSNAAQLRRFLSSLALPSARRYSSYMRLFDGGTIVALQGPKLRNADRGGSTHRDTIDINFGRRRHGCGTVGEIRDDVRAAMAVDRMIYLPDDLLTKVDRASMLHALEVRSPFMDHELVQFAAGLTTDQLIKGGPKRMLREAFAADLPDFVFKRKKMGFAVPIGDWLRKELRPMLHDCLFATNSFARAHFNLEVVRRLVDEHESQRVEHSQRLYALLMLELWHRGTM